MTLAESLVALAILGVGLLMGVAVVAWAERIERRAERRVAAVELAASVAERMRVVSYPSLASGRLELGSEVAGSPLPDPVVDVHVDEDEDAGLKRVSIVVRWGGREPGSVTLAAAVGAAGIYR